MRKRNKSDKSNEIWIESDLENQIPQLDVEHIDTFAYEDLIVMDQTNSNDEFTAANESRKRKILTDDNNDDKVKKCRVVSRQNNPLFNGKYYSLIAKTQTGIEAKCMCCGNPLKGYGAVSSNFITHLRNVSVRMYTKFK